MTEEDALHEASQRWGIEAAIRHWRAHTPHAQQSYAVGVSKDGLFIMHGQGDSWEEAFEDADRQSTEE